MNFIDYPRPAPHLLKFFFALQEDLDDIVDPKPLKCNKCNRWPRKQVKICGEFGHVLCAETCAKELVSKENESATMWKCPIMKDDKKTGFHTNCGGKINAHTLSQDELEMEDAIWKYKKPVFCPYQDCKKRMQSMDLWEHVNTCMHAWVACPMYPNHKLSWMRLREHLRVEHNVQTVDDCKNNRPKEMDLPVMVRNDEGTVLVFESGKAQTGVVSLGSTSMPPPAVRIYHNDKPVSEPELKEEDDYILITGGTKTPTKPDVYYPKGVCAVSTKNLLGDIKGKLRFRKKTGRIVLKID